MVPITELMAYGSRRKIEAIASELGYPPAEAYPDEVLTAVQQRDQAESWSKSSTSAHAAATSEQAAEAEVDLGQVQQAAESRAAGLLVALDTLTMMHCATRKFSDPNLQQAVDDSQNRLKHMLTGITTYYHPDHFLAQPPLAQGMTGGDGLTASLNGSNKPLPASEPVAVASDS